MIRPDAEGLIAFVDATWKMGLADDDFGHERWLEFFMSQDDPTAMLVVLQKIASRQRHRPTIMDVRSALASELVEPEAEPATAAEEFVRQIPGWVKIWIVARASDDNRVLAEQKPGYEFMQYQYPFQRKYVWPDQEPMPDEARAGYAAAAARLGAGLHKVFAETVLS